MLDERWVDEIGDEGKKKIRLIKGRDDLRMDNEVIVYVKKRIEKLNN